MEAKPINKISDLEWLSLLERAAGGQVGQDRKKRTYLYIKKEQVDFFDSKKEAKSFGFKPLSLNQMTKLTQEKMNECKDPVVLEKISIALHKITLLVKGDKKLYSSVGGFFGFSSKKHANKMEAFATEINTKSLELTLKCVTSIQKSTEGFPGVIFLDTNTERRLVIKPSNEPITEFSGERFFNFMGFITPYSMVVHKDSDEGSAIFKTIDEKRHDLPDNKSERVHDMVTTSSHYLVMDFLKATTFKQLLTNEMQIFIQNPKVLQQMGEMVFYDQFTGNNDRLGLNECNLENFMIVPGENKLALIDSEIHTNRSSVNNDLMLLMSQKGKELITRVFTETISKKHRGLEIDHEFILQNIGIGIEKGVLNLLEKFSDKKSIKMFAEFPELPPSKNLDPKILIQRLKLIEKLLKEREEL